jgi:hypothetical protein
VLHRLTMDIFKVNAADIADLHRVSRAILRAAFSFSKKNEKRRAPFCQKNLKPSL